MSGKLSVDIMLSIQGELDTTRTLLHSSNERNKELLNRIKELEEEKKAYKEHLLQTQNDLAATNAHHILATPIKTQNDFAANKTQTLSTRREILRNIMEENKDLIIRNIMEENKYLVHRIQELEEQIEYVTKKAQIEELEMENRSTYSHIGDIIDYLSKFDTKLLESEERNKEQLEGQRNAKELNDNEVFSIKLSDYLQYVERMESVKGGVSDSLVEIEDKSGKKTKIDLKKMSLVSILTFSFSSVRMSCFL